MRVWHLGPDRVREWHRIRLEMLLHDGDAFGSYYEDWAERPLSDFKMRLMKARHFAAGQIEGQPLAVACWEPNRNEPDLGWIMSVYAKPEARGQGYAKAVLRHIIEDATMQGMARLGLHVVSSNLPAQRLYARLGFIDTQVAGILNDHGVPELRMTRDLSPMA